MAPEPVTAERAYGLLKSDILSGRLAPGSSLVERQLAMEYGMSISPVRDAAHRLLGERMVELVQVGGYRVPLLTASALRDLYAWHSHLVRLILKDQMPADPLLPTLVPVIDTAQTVAAAAAGIFRALAASARNEQFGLALRGANDRLAATRVSEGEVLRNLDGELARVAEAICGSDRNRFGVLWAYHRRRIRRADKIAMIGGRTLCL